MAAIVAVGADAVGGAGSVASAVSSAALGVGSVVVAFDVADDSVGVSAGVSCAAASEPSPRVMLQTRIPIPRACAMRAVPRGLCTGLLSRVRQNSTLECNSLQLCYAPKRHHRVSQDNRGAPATAMGGAVCSWFSIRSDEYVRASPHRPCRSRRGFSVDRR